MFGNGRNGAENALNISHYYYYSWYFGARNWSLHYVSGLLFFCFHGIHIPCKGNLDLDMWVFVKRDGFLLSQQLCF